MPPSRTLQSPSPHPSECWHGPVSRGVTSRLVFDPGPEDHGRWRQWAGVPGATLGWHPVLLGREADPTIDLYFENIIEYSQKAPGEYEQLSDACSCYCDYVLE